MATQVNNLWHLYSHYSSLKDYQDKAETKIATESFCALSLFISTQTIKILFFEKIPRVEITI